MRLRLIFYFVILFKFVHGDVPCPPECECFYKIYSLYADCSGRNLEEFPSSLDDQVQGLDLSNNFLTAIPQQISAFRQLEILNISFNRIKEVHQDTLMNSTNLLVLDLSNNEISSLQDINANRLFLQTSIKRLILSRNQIIFTTQPSGYISSDTLEMLELESCGITNIEEKSFVNGLTALKILKMAHNPLRKMRIVSPTLQALDVSRCQLSRITSKTLEYLPSLTHLYISHNYRLDLSSKTSSFASSSLLYVDMSYCNMDKISLSGLPNINTLILKGNMIRRLSGGEFFNNSRLITLDLSSNAIGSVHQQSFLGLGSLKNLNLSVNVIPSIHEETFLRTPNLTQVSLSRNYISYLGSLQSSSIVELDVSTCEIQYVDPNIFQSMPRLLIINLSRNLISTIPHGIRSKSLQEFDLSFNRISQIDEFTFQHLPSLLRLDLSGNRFTATFQKSYFENNTNLKEFNLEDNTWRCDCHDNEMKELFVYLTYEPSKVWDLNSLMCHSPSNVSGQNWLKACYFQWFPEHFESTTSKAMHFLLAVLCAFFICFIILYLIKRSLRIKILAEQEEQRRRAEEARERFREQQMRREQEVMRNAPDPRDLVSPPTYEEALLMPRLDSFHSLSDMATNNAKQKKRAQRRTRSSGDLLDEEEPVHDRRRRRRKSRDRRDVNGRRPRSRSTTNVTSQSEDTDTQEVQVRAVVYRQESDL